ncbi:T9SS type A sorting domain-containing protein [Dyadobacter sp. CY312]|uniref:T9SS type A sorting domain-containing protein n=1 Tax=Dyadobacter sp. CY312 TaxID=2907303 RepID=UPI001F239049|nr:T9SS type A sorting domain-containing protein [Dyadobacter sp. CY312]MCE7042232.1 T9SS type A sorting domain-containing protein [Dyadobacter sp. CY312]
MNFTSKKIIGLLFLLVFCAETYGQRVYSVVFNQLPKDMQLYARDDNNLAEVPISGIIEIPGWSHFSVVVYRNGERVGYKKSVLNYAGKSSASFEMKPQIKAELADYSFEVFACKELDSLSIIKRNEVVAGDFYVISGQSNASATIFGDWSSKYARTIARIPDNNPVITPGDTMWIPAAWSWTYVGAWGLELQRNIIEKEGIPTCVINGSIPGKKISDFLMRDQANPANPNTLYGSLLNRVGKANPTRIRKFFWVHGEQEIFEYITNYPQEYDLLYKNWITDYKTVEEFVVLQANLILLNHTNPNPVGGLIRDFLRRTKYLYEKTDHFTPIATPGYDGVHYSRAGYEELGRRLFRFIRPSVYKSTDLDNVRCPDIVRAAYTTEKKDEIVLTFSEGQELKWAADTTVKGQDGQPLTLRLKDFFYLDGNEINQQVSSGRAEGNKVILTLKEPANATKISYLPSFMPKNLPDPTGLLIGFLSGPFLTNKRGLGAFSFNNITIETSPILGVETANNNSYWHLYPNPVTDLLKVNFQQPATGKLTIHNLTGRVYFSKGLKAVEYYDVEVSTWPAGLYFVTMEDVNGKILSKKIVKR